MSELDPGVRRAIDALAIPYEVLDCSPEWADTEVFCAQYDIPKDHAANTILVASKSEPKQYSASLVLGTTKLDVNHVVSALMGIKRLSFANADETMALTGMMIGGVTIFGLPASVPIYVDGSVMQRDYVIVGGGNRSTKIKLAPAHLLSIPNATVIERLAIPR